MAQDFAKRRRDNGASRVAAQRAQAQRHKAEPTSSRGKSLRIYLTGVASGVFLSLLFYLSTLPGPGAPEQEQAAESPPPPAEIPRPRFDFYTTLPQQTLELEDETVEAVEPAAVLQPPAPPAAPQVYFLQAGSFRQQEDAEGRRAQLLLLGLTPRIEDGSDENGRWFRIYLGPFDSPDSMNRTRALLASQNIESLLLKREGQ